MYSQEKYEWEKVRQNIHDMGMQLAFVSTFEHILGGKLAVLNVEFHKIETT